MRSLVIVALLGCTAAQAELKETSPSSFDGYWNRGQAEITSYTLEQARYGEVHRGHAVLVYVTEPFSKSKQVKLDDTSSAGADHVPVLKLNFTRKFNTGVYPYSMMTSIFSPVAGGPSLKVSATSQEWCGHTFMQLNQRGPGYEGVIYSYFESEGDQKISIPTPLLEDQIWTTIRLAPNTLPTGKIDMVPGSTHLRLRHLRAESQRVEASLEQVGERMRYHISYIEIDRELTIEFERDFPHQILGWTERYVSGWGATAKTLTTKATKKKTLMSAYWVKHNNVDRGLRTQLGLSED